MRGVRCICLWRMEFEFEPGGWVGDGFVNSLCVEL